MTRPERYYHYQQVSEPKKKNKTHHVNAVFRKDQTSPTPLSEACLHSEIKNDLASL